MPSSRKIEVLARLVNDITTHGGVHIIGNKQVGKSNLKKHIARYAFQNCSEVKTIIIDPEGSWEFDFDSIRFFRVPKNSMRIVEEPIGVRLNGSVFTKKTYRMSQTIAKTVKQLVLDDEPILFVIELDDPEECGYFSAFVLEIIYDYQRIKRKYWKGNLPRAFLVVAEEAENIFDNQSLEKRLFNTLRKKYAEMANLRIGILSSSQRLTEVNKKFRGKMHGYLIGYTSVDDCVGNSQVGKIMKKVYPDNPDLVLNKDFIHKFFYTPTKEVVEVPKFIQNGKPHETKPKTEVRPQHKQPKQTKKKGLLTRILEKLTGTSEEQLNQFRGFSEREPEEEESDREFWEEEEEYDNTFWEEWEEF